MEEKHNKLSRFLSLVLRHKPEEIGLALDSQGYLSVDELIEGINNTGRVIDKRILDEILSSDNKQRYSYDSTGTRIRANQGHSIEVNLGLQKKTPPKILYHGTAEKFVSAIEKEGLIRKKRTYVHLSKDLETAKDVGSRRGEPVIFEIDTEAMIEDDYEFYVSENGVWLTERVPVQYLSKRLTNWIDVCIISHDDIFKLTKFVEEIIDLKHFA